MDLTTYFGYVYKGKPSVDISIEMKNNFGRSLARALFNGELKPASSYQVNFNHDALSEAKIGFDRRAKIDNIKQVSEWIKFKNVSTLELIQAELLDAFEIIEDLRSSDDHFYTCCNMLKLLIESDTPTAAMKIFNDLFSLKFLLPHLSASGQNDKILSLCKLLTTLAEKLIPKICNGWTFGKEIVETILSFAPFYKLAPETFAFWNQLMQTSKIKDFNSHIEKLILSLAQSYCHMKFDHDSSIKVKEEDFKENERKWADIIHDASKVINAQRGFDLFYHQLVQPGTTKIEADTCLFMIKNLAEFVDTKDRCNVLELVKNILTADESSPYMAQFIAIIRMLSKWVSEKDFVLVEVLNFLAKSLTKKDLGEAAARALKDVCCDCHRAMKPFLADLFNIVENLNLLNLSEDGESYMIKAILETISSLPIDQFLTAMEKLCEIQIKRIDNFKHLSSLLYIDQLKMIFENAEAKLSSSDFNPVAQVFLSYWNILKEMIQFYQNDEAIFGKLIGLVENALKKFKMKLFPIFKDFTDLIVSLKNVELALKLSVGLCEAIDSERASEILIIFESLATMTFDALRSDEKLVEKLFELAIIVFSKAPLEFMQTPSIVSILELAIHQLNSTGNTTNALKLIAKMLTVDSENDILRQYQLDIMGRYSGLLIQVLLQSSLFTEKQSKLSQTVFILHTMKTASSDAFKFFLSEALSRITRRTCQGKIIPTYEALCKKFLVAMSSPLATKADQLKYLQAFTKSYRATTD